MNCGRNVCEIIFLHKIHFCYFCLRRKNAHDTNDKKAKKNLFFFSFLDEAHFEK